MPTEDAPRTLRRRMGLGVALFAAVSVASRGLAFVTLAVLARQLTPEEFGLVAYAAFATGLVTLAVDRHFELSLVRLERISQERIDTVFTLRMILVAAIALLMLATAGPVSGILDVPELRAVLVALALVPILSGLFNPRFIVLERDLAFGPVARAEIIVQAVTTLVTVGLVVLTKSYWAAVAGMIATSAARSLLSWTMVGGRVRLGFAEARETMRYSVWLIASSIVAFLNGQMNRLFTGAFLGLAALGQFRLGAELAKSAIYFIQRPVVRVAYPGLSEAKARGRDVGEAFLLFQNVLMIVILPVSVLMALAGPWLIRVAAGTGWQEAVPVLQVMALLLVTRALTAGTQSIVLVDGRTWLSFGRQLIVLVCSIPMLWYGGKFHGLAGILAATAAAQILSAALTLLIVLEVARIGLARFAKGLAGAALATSAMGLALIWLTLRLPEAEEMGLAGAIGALSVLGLAGAAVYVPVLMLIWHLSGRPDSAEAFAARLLGAALRRLT